MNTPKTYKMLYLVKFGYDKFMFENYKDALAFFETVGTATPVKHIYQDGVDLVQEKPATLELTRVTNQVVAESQEAVDAFAVSTMEAIA